MVVLFFCCLYFLILSRNFLCDIGWFVSVCMPGFVGFIASCSLQVNFTPNAVNTVVMVDNR